MRKSALSVSFDDLYPENEAKYGSKWLAFIARPSRWIEGISYTYIQGLGLSALDLDRKSSLWMLKQES